MAQPSSTALRDPAGVLRRGARRDRRPRSSCRRRGRRSDPGSWVTPWVPARRSSRLCGGRLLLTRRGGQPYSRATGICRSRSGQLRRGGCVVWGADAAGARHALVPRAQWVSRALLEAEAPEQAEARPGHGRRSRLRWRTEQDGGLPPTAEAWAALIEFYVELATTGQALVREATRGRWDDRADRRRLRSPLWRRAAPCRAAPRWPSRSSRRQADPRVRRDGRGRSRVVGRR